MDDLINQLQLKMPDEPIEEIERDVTLLRSQGVPDEEILAKVDTHFQSQAAPDVSRETIPPTTSVRPEVANYLTKGRAGSPGGGANNAMSAPDSRQAVYDKLSKPTTGQLIAEAFAGLGDSIASSYGGVKNNAMERSQKIRQEGAKGAMDVFDKKITDAKTQREMSNLAEEDDANSEVSQTYQALAGKLMNRDPQEFAGKSATQLKALLPALEKIYAADTVKLRLESKNQQAEDFLIDPTKKDEAFTKTGDEFLRYVKPEFRSTLKGVASGKIKASNLLSTRFGGAENLFSLSSQYKGEPVDETVNTARHSIRRDFTSGKTANNVRSLNTAIGHLNSLYDVSRTLGNVPFQKYNSISNWTKKEVGQPQVARFEAARNAVAGEMATIFKGTSGTDQEIREWKNVISNAQSPEQLEGSIRQMIELMKSRLDAFKGQWDPVMGEDFAFVNEKSKKILKNLGYNEDMTRSDEGAEVSGMTPEKKARLEQLRAKKKAGTLQ